MKKITALLLALMMLAGVFASCGKPKDTGKAGKLKVVTTIFPEYDWVRAILGDKADNTEVTMLLDNGVDLHSYQPTADDIVRISDCDLFVYVGGESDGWVENALKNAANRNMKVINLLEVLGDSVKTEETVEGMQEDDHGHGHSHDEQLTEDDIRDRSLSDFAGAWKSLHPYLLNGDLDKFCEHRAEKDGDSSTTKDTYLEKFKASWQCDAEKISINGNTITFTYGDGKTVSAEYTYAGYQPKLDDEGNIRSVRYQFETTSADAPKYVQFNDHGHEPGEAEHFHIYFGNDGFDALMSAKTNPFFVKDALSVEDILDELMGHDHGEEKDEHVWLSLKNASLFCDTIASILADADPEHSKLYQQNADTYEERLAVLDQEYKTTVEQSQFKTVLFADRFPFRYLTDDYELTYYAAFTGCSAETDTSFETITFLAGKLDELKLPVVFTIENSDQKIAKAVIENTKTKDQKILSLNSMQSVTKKEVEEGTTYLSIMENNLEILKEAL